MLPVLALLAAGPPAAAADASALTREELARLDRGEVVARLVPLPGEAARSARAGLAARVLPSSPERLFRAAADADHWAEWVPFLEGSERSAEAGGGVSWRLAFDLPLPLRDRHYRARLGVARPAGAEREANLGGRWTVSWASVPGSGNVARAAGSFTLAPRGPGRTLVVFRSATETGDRTPRFLQERALLQSLPWVLDGLRQQAERCRYAVPWPDGCREERPGPP
jgi:hypothetical protein